MGSSDECGDLSQLRLAWESENQWNLRDAFLRRHWGSLPRNRLISLSQIFINVEFLGCQYNKSLMELVEQMSAGLADDYRSERKKVVQKTFVKATDNIAARSDQKRQSGADLGTRKPHLDQQPASKRAREDFEVNPKIPAALSKEKSLVLVKAQLSVAPTTLGPLELLNYACNRAKVSWQLQFTSKNDLLLCELGLDSVIITRQYCQDKLNAKISACKSATERLKCAHLDVRDSKMGDHKLWLFTTSDKRGEWKGPDEHMFVLQEQQMKTLKIELEEMTPEERQSDPLGSLEKACTVRQVPFDYKSEHLTGWKGQISVFVAGVSVYDHVLQGAKALARDKEAEIQTQSCLNAIQQILCSNHRVFEDSNGKLKMLASNEQITDELLSKTLQEEAIPQKKQETLPHSISSRLILLQQSGQTIDEYNARGILNCSCQFSKVQKQEQEEVLAEGYRCAIYIDDVMISEATEANKKESNVSASLEALQVLQRHCYTIVSMSKVDKSSPEVNAQAMMEDLSKFGSNPSNASNSLDQSNIGNKLLRKMGWSGGGIGKDGQGIAQPITVHEVFRRQGLGMIGSQSQFTKAIKALLEDYVKSDKQDDLVFTADMNNEQRKVIHQVARRLRLKSVSYGTGDDRQLTVQRIRTAQQLLQLLLELGGENGKYKVIAPENK